MEEMGRVVTVIAVVAVVAATTNAEVAALRGTASSTSWGRWRKR
jgi:hypothetical protein